MSTSEQTPDLPEPTEAAVPAPTSAGPDLSMAIGQLRVLVCGVGLGLLLLSLAFSFYVMKQNRNLGTELSARQGQMQQMQDAQQRMIPAVNELAQYTSGSPDLAALFRKYGIQVNAPQAPPTSGAPFAPAPAPAP